MKMRRPEPETSHQTSKEIAGSCGMIQTAWSWVSEPVGISKSNAFNASGLLEQINTTADVTDYLWYSIRYEGYYILKYVLLLQAPVDYVLGVCDLMALMGFLTELKFMEMSHFLMGTRPFFMWKLLAMSFMLSSMESLQVI